MDTSPLRIAHLTTTHPRADTRIFQKMCLSLAAHGYQVSLVLADGEGDARESGVQVLDVGRPATPFRRALLASWRVFRAGLRTRARLFHLHDPELMPYGLLLRLMGKRVVYDIHEYYRDIFLDIYYLPRPLRHACAHIYGLGEWITSRVVNACVVAAADMRRSLNLPHATVIENYVKISEFRPPAMRAPSRTVCYVGVLHHSRGVGEMVDAAQSADVTLLLAGRYYSDTLRQQVSARPGWAKVRELGFITRRRMQEVFDESVAGLVILTPRQNYNNSSCNKLFEYMAAGLPVIASDLPFARGVIAQHGCGLLVNPPTDPAAIAAAIRQLVDNPQEAAEMGRRGREAVERHYSWEQEEKKLLALYAGLLHG